MEPVGLYFVSGTKLHCVESVESTSAEGPGRGLRITYSIKAVGKKLPINVKHTDLHRTAQDALASAQRKADDHYSNYLSQIERLTITAHRFYRKRESLRKQLTKIGISK